MGVVYRARDRASGKVVALKLLQESSLGPVEDERFVREAQLLSELRHDNIVSYIAHGQTAEGQQFLVMEWLEGEDLAHRLTRGPLPLRDCLRLLERVAAALVVSHQRGIVHRDRSHKHKICSLSSHMALHLRRTDDAFLPLPHCPY